MERVLNADALHMRWPPQSAADIHLAAPTLGRCPICRRALSLFEVVDDESNEPLHPTDIHYHTNSTTTHYPLKDTVYIPYHGRVGQLSFHWDWSKIKNRNSTLPFLNFTEAIQKSPETWTSPFLRRRRMYLNSFWQRL
jgi:hypothetical protein